MKRVSIIACCLSLWLVPAMASAEEFSILTFEYAPYSYTAGNGEVKGSAVDVVREAFRRTGHTARIKVVPFARALVMLKDGLADGFFTAYKNPEREVYADFSREVVMPQVQVLFVNSKSTIEFDGDLAKLGAYRFGAVTDMSYGSVFDAAVNNKAISKIERVTTQAANFRKLAVNRVDVVPCNRDIGLYEISELKLQGKIKYLTPSVQSIPSYIAYSKLRNLGDLRDKLDEALRDMKSDGTHQRIVEQYGKQ